MAKKVKEKKSDIILELDQVSYRYSDAPIDEYVLKDISYQFERGMLYAVKGKSGSGKTTLLSLLSGLEKPTSGTIYYEGQNINEMDLDIYRNTLIGIIFQSYNLLPHLTASENIILSMDISKVKVDNSKLSSIDLLEQVGLDKSYADKRILKLSGGEQQRVAIARSLSYHPGVILADEPTGNLDKETEDEIIKIFKKLAKEENKCVIIVTHSKNVCDHADAVYELKMKK